jgi:hypothetical protein
LDGACTLYEPSKLDVNLGYLKEKRTIKEKTSIGLCAELGLKGGDALGIRGICLAEMRIHDVLPSIDNVIVTVDTLNDPSAERYWYWSAT